MADASHTSADGPESSTYNAGQLDIDGLITRTYTLDRVNEAYEELERGVVGRGIITFE